MSKYRDSQIKTEAALIRKRYYLITFITLSALLITFNLSHYIVLKDQSDQAAKSLEDTVNRLSINKLKDQINMVFQYMDFERKKFIDELSASGDPALVQRAEAQLKARLAECVKDLYLPDDAYIWIHEIIHDQNGKVYIKRLAHRFSPEGGIIQLEHYDDEGFPFKEEYLSVQKTGEALLYYYYPKPNDSMPYPKMSYSRLYKDYSWIIGAGVYLDNIELVIKQEQSIAESANRNRISKDNLGFLLIILIIIAFMVFVDRIMHKAIKSSYARILLVENALKEEKLKLDEAYALMKELAEHDELTGLKNRRSGLARLELELARAKRAKASFCVALGDIDHFKIINDTYGHEAGDQLLKKIARTLEEALRLEDMAIRWGGEEFLILLSGSTLSQSMEAAERLREAAGRQSLELKNETISATISIGVAEYYPGERLEDLISRSDAAMYKAKTLGRNRVIASQKPNY